MRNTLITAAFIVAALLATDTFAGNVYSNACGTSHGSYRAGHKVFAANNHHVGKFNNFNHGYHGGYFYYPSQGYYAPQQQAGYKSLAQQIGEENARQIEALMVKYRIPEALARARVEQGEHTGLSTAGQAVNQHCGKCHGDGGANQDVFDTTGEWSYEKANRAQKAFMGLLEDEGVPNMAKKAGIQGDGDAIQSVLADFTELPRAPQRTEPSSEPAVEPRRGLWPF